MSLLSCCAFAMINMTCFGTVEFLSLWLIALSGVRRSLLSVDSTQLNAVCLFGIHDATREAPAVVGQKKRLYSIVSISITISTRWFVI